MIAVGDKKRRKGDLEQITARFEKCAKEVPRLDRVYLCFGLFRVFGFQEEGLPSFHVSYVSPLWTR